MKSRRRLRLRCRAFRIGREFARIGMAFALVSMMPFWMQNVPPQTFAQDLPPGVSFTVSPVYWDGGRYYQYWATNARDPDFGGAIHVGGTFFLDDETGEHVTDYSVDWSFIEDTYLTLPGYVIADNCMDMLPGCAECVAEKRYRCDSDWAVDLGIALAEGGGLALACGAEVERATRGYVKALLIACIAAGIAIAILKMIKANRVHIDCWCKAPRDCANQLGVPCHEPGVPPLYPCFGY
jgi:hypothetical protein